MTTDDEAPAKNVVEALIRVMRDLPGIGKDSHAAPQQGGYAYRGIDQITPEVQPLFVRHGVLFGIPRVVNWEVRDITVNNKPWTDVYEEVEYDVYGPGGVEDKLTVGPILSIGRDNADKGGNKCLTQAYKYALLQALCISDAKDDGDNVSVEADAEPESATGITSDALGGIIAELLAAFNVDDTDQAHAKAIWKKATPKKAEDGLIYETEQARVTAIAEDYIAALAPAADGDEPF